MRESESTNDRVPRRTALAAALSMAGLLLVVGCDGMGEEGEPVDAEASALRNTGRTPEQQKCDGKLQSCYIDCSVKYPDSGGGLNEDLREGCFDSCDAAHRLCLPARILGTAVGGVLQAAAVVDPQATTTAQSPAADTVSTRAALKSCTATSDGGLWCCVPISTPPYLKCTYTPPPDTIWTLTRPAARAP
jgi:hypothetical protein